MNLDPVAIYAAVISTLLGILELVKYIRDRPQLNIDVEYNSPAGELVARVTNNGSRPITVTEWGATLFYSKGENDLLSNSNAPTKGRSISTGPQQVNEKLDEGDIKRLSLKAPKLAEYQLQCIWIHTASKKQTLRSKQWPLYRKRYPFDRPRPELKVEVVSSSSGKSAIRIRVTNLGNVPIGIESCGLKYSDGTGISFQMPFGGRLIQPRDEYLSGTQSLNVPEGLVELASALDCTSHIWVSRKWPLSAKK